MRNLSGVQQTVLKRLLWLAALLPFVRLLVCALTDRLGANPLEFITRSSGDWTLYFLCITLAITPLRRISGIHWLVRWRRMLGLYSFFYASLHLLCFVWFDHFFELSEIIKDVLKRPFITVGMLAFFLLLPLAITSTDGMIRRLGGQRWRWLHRLVYLIVPAGVLHYYWMKAGKHDLLLPYCFAVLVTVLLASRLSWANLLRRKTAGS